MKKFKPKLKHTLLFFLIAVLASGGMLAMTGAQATKELAERITGLIAGPKD